MKTTAKRIAEMAGAACRGSQRSKDGFTLIELLIAVGALAFVAVGVAAIFEATGRTIRAGRRVSDFSSYANLIEQQMRADFAAMTRDGFLVIRNEFPDVDDDGQIDIPMSEGVPGQDAVPLYQGEPAWRSRSRRTDEILFFAKGKFVSLRDALDARFVARSDAAQIYYGHGERRINKDGSQSGPLTAYRRPELNDNIDPNDQNFGIDPEARLGYRSTVYPNQPNRYASDWVLVRRVTLLCPPATSAYKPGGNLPPVLQATSRGQRLDSDVQVALQPAASSIFRALATGLPTTVPPRIRSTPNGDDRPQLASGLVDIVTTDLSEIRLIVTTADNGPGDPGFDPATFLSPAVNVNGGNDGNNAGVDGIFRLATTGTMGALNRAHAWMDDAFPAWSMADGADRRKRTRIRCELAPTDYVGISTQGNGNPTFVPEGQRLERAYRRADQAMLAASSFLPHCTEFIVEWSFGHTWPSDPMDPNYSADHAGQLVWYGPPRVVNRQLVATTYGAPIAHPTQGGTIGFPWNQAEKERFRKIDGSTGSVDLRADVVYGTGFNAATHQAGDPLTSYFGYVDPTFNPDSDNDGKLVSPGDSVSPTMPWPWPKLIRVTLSLADPNDPTVEQSFQFVFEVPQATQQ